MISPALLALSLDKNSWDVLLLVESLPCTHCFFRTFCMMSSSSAPLNPESFAGPDLPISSSTAEFSVSLGRGAGVVVVTVVVVEPSAFLVTVVFEVDSWFEALVESPVIVVPVLAWGSAAAAAATASSETVVTVSWLVVLSAGVAGLVELMDLSDEAAGC